MLWCPLRFLPRLNSILVTSCDVRYDFRMKTMFGSSLLPSVCTRAHVLFMLFVLACVHSGIQHVSTLWLTWRVSCKRKELLTLREHLGSPPVLVGSVLRILFAFCVVLHLFFCLHHVSCVPNVSGLSILNCSFGFL